jgi:hypothetical protein
MKKNGFLTFIFAWGPGCGQMYQGYMKRGVSLMAWFFAVIGLGLLLRDQLLFPALWVALPIIWAYSFFDTFNLRALSPEQRAAMPDFFIPNPAWVRSWTNPQNTDGRIYSVRLAKIGGWVLIILGAAALLQTMWNNFGWILYDLSPRLYDLVSRLPWLVLSALIILAGVWLLTRQSKQRGAGEDKHD